MTKKEIQEGNLLIAKFIGMYETELGWFDYEEILKLPNTTDNTFDKLLFHEDWNWLMSVIDYIKCIGIEEYHLLDKIDDNLIICELEETYKSVISLIKWYNPLLNDK